MDEPIKVKHRELGHILILNRRECKLIEQHIFGGGSVCKHCGEPFVKSWIHASRHEFCSPRCYSKYHHKPKHYDPRPCKKCGKIFTPKHHLNVYCSNECCKRASYKRRRSNR